MARFSKADKKILKAFTNLNETVLRPDSLDRKTKTLMCLAIGIANGSEFCLAVSASQAKDADALRKELLETASVDLLMSSL